MSNPETYLIIGIGIHLIFWLFNKLLLKSRLVLIPLTISALMGFIAFNSQGFDNLQMTGGYAANWFYSPAMFLITHTVLRYLFKLIFKNEPILSGYLSMSWEQGEYRKLHLGDSLFTVLTLVIPMLIPLFL